MATFLSLIVTAHVHSVTHGQLQKSPHTYVKHAMRKAHFKLNGAFRSFKIILIGVIRNPESSVVVMHDNIDLISETFEDMAVGKLHIRRFQPPHSDLVTVIPEKLSNDK